MPLAGARRNVLSEQHTRIVEKENTLSLDGKRLQPPSTDERAHFVRCEVTVHRMPGGEMAVTYLGRLLGRHSAQGIFLTSTPARRREAALPQANRADITKSS